MLGLYELSLVQLNIFMYNTLPQFSSYLPAAFQSCTLDRVAQLVTGLAADPGVASSIPACSHTFVQIDHEIISMVIILLGVIQEGMLSDTSERMCAKYWITA